MAATIEDLNELISKINLINFKYEKVLDSHQYDFNVFTILRNESDEENLHSKFLYEILNPQGSHNKGSIFLKLFLSTIGIQEFTLTPAKTIVKKEYQNIDIFIKNQNQAIIIENKIYAGDQEKQLERYYKIVENEGSNYIRIIYLTLHGDAPSDQSIGELNADVLIKLVSYKEDINDWLSACIKECAAQPILRETLIQYQILIQKLTGKFHSIGYIMEIKNLLLDEKNIRLATDLCDALIDAKIEIQYSFWQGTLSELQLLGYEVDERSCTKESIVEYYTKSKNNKYFGLGIKISSDFEDNDVLQFWIEINWNIYYGFRMLNNQNILNQLDEKYSRIAGIIKGIDSCFTRDSRWLGWKYPNRKFNFKTFNDENIFALANDVKRSAYTKELANEINEIINKFKTTIQIKTIKIATSCG